MRTNNCKSINTHVFVCECLCVSCGYELWLVKCEIGLLRVRFRRTPASLDVAEIFYEISAEYFYFAFRLSQICSKKKKNEI